jgi:hypothetical protein
MISGSAGRGVVEKVLSGIVVIDFIVPQFF